MKLIKIWSRAIKWFASLGLWVLQLSDSDRRRDMANLMGNFETLLSERTKNREEESEETKARGRSSVGANQGDVH